MNNHPRIWSLRDIMNKFYVTSFAFIMHELSRAKLGFTMMEYRGFGASKPSAEPLEIMESILNHHRHSSPSDLSIRAFEAAKIQWSDPLLNVSRAAQIAARLEHDLVDGTMNREFLWIAADREKLIDQEDLFGDLVSRKFPSAVADIREAGNCLAAECPTASVFHLMRTAEIGLRALARDREIAFPDKPLELKEWGEILPNLDSKVAKMREESVKKWTDAQIKEIQVRFYGEVSQELRVFNEAWRRHLAHAREDAFYDRDYAADVMKHVKKFMHKLASKISEKEITSKYWTG
jgi:hypothetical protein